MVAASLAGAVSPSSPSLSLMAKGPLPYNIQEFSGGDLAAAFSGCVTLGQSLAHSVPQFLLQSIEQS